MGKITPYIIVFIAGIILGSITHKLHFFCANTATIKDSIVLMSEPKIIVDSFPYPIYISSKSEIPSILPQNFVDTIVDSTLCCIDYKLCAENYNKLYNYTDTVLRIRGYLHTIEDSLIKITVKDTTVGKLIYADLTYFIKPIIRNSPKLKPSLFLNAGYDLTTSKILLGADYNKNKIIIGYLGDIKNQNAIKIGYKIK